MTTSFGCATLTAGSRAPTISSVTSIRSRATKAFMANLPDRACVGRILAPGSLRPLQAPCAFSGGPAPSQAPLGAFSRAQLMGRIPDGARRLHQAFQGHALVGRRPLAIDPDVAGAVLHGGDAVGHDDVAVADVAEAPPAADHRGCAARASLPFRECAHQRV